MKALARRLRATPGKHIWMMGGGGLIASFLDALLDRICLLAGEPESERLSFDALDPVARRDAEHRKRPVELEIDGRPYDAWSWKERQRRLKSGILED